MPVRRRDRVLPRRERFGRFLFVVERLAEVVGVGVQFVHGGDVQHALHVGEDRAVRRDVVVDEAGLRVRAHDHEREPDAEAARRLDVVVEAAAVVVVDEDRRRGAVRTFLDRPDLFADVFVAEAHRGAVVLAGPARDRGRGQDREARQVPVCRVGEQLFGFVHVVFLGTVEALGERRADRPFVWAGVFAFFFRSFLFARLRRVDPPCQPGFFDPVGDGRHVRDRRFPGRRRCLPCPGRTTAPF